MAFLTFMGQPLVGTDWYVPSWQQVAEFLDDGERSPATKRAYLAALRAFSRWMMASGYAEVDPTSRLPKVRVPRSTPRPVSTDQLGVALASGRFYRRTRTMVLLEAYQGLRAHEVAKVRGEDIRLDTGHLRVVGKGGVEVYLPLHPLVAAEALNYPRVGWWFPSPKDPDRPILAKSVSNVLSKALRRAGVPATGHNLRHWYGTETLRSAGGNLRVCQELMRHASLATTAIYTFVDDTERRAAVAGLPLVG